MQIAGAKRTARCGGVGSWAGDGGMADAPAKVRARLKEVSRGPTMECPFRAKGYLEGDPGATLLRRFAPGYDGFGPSARWIFRRSDNRGNPTKSNQIKPKLSDGRAICELMTRTRRACPLPKVPRQRRCRMPPHPPCGLAGARPLAPLESPKTQARGRGSAQNPGVFANSLTEGIRPFDFAQGLRLNPT